MKYLFSIHISKHPASIYHHFHFVVAAVIDISHSVSIREQPSIAHIYTPYYIVGCQWKLVNHLQKGHRIIGKTHTFAYTHAMCATPGWPHDSLLSGGVRVCAKHAGKYFCLSPYRRHHIICRTLTPPSFGHIKLERARERERMEGWTYPILHHHRTHKTHTAQTHIKYT